MLHFGLETAKRFAEPLRRLQGVLDKPATVHSLDEPDKRLLRRHAPTIAILRKQLVSSQAMRAERIEGSLVEQGFLRLDGPASYIPFVPATWATRFPSMLGTTNGCVLFEVVNRTPDMTIKLVIPSLGEGVQDPLVSERRRLVQLIHDSGSKDAFPGAFYKRQAVTPRPATPRYYSVFTETFRLPEESTEDAVTRWVESTLAKIKRLVLPAIEPMMEKCGLR